MKPSPSGWPRISSGLYYDDPAAAIDWLCRTFGFEVRIRVEGEDGSIAHSELVFGDGLIMVGSAKKGAPWSYRRSPKSTAGANTQNLMVYVDDVAAHLVRARAAGAKIVSDMKTTDYGAEHWTDRGYEAEDLEGHHWWFFERLRTPGA